MRAIKLLAVVCLSLSLLTACPPIQTPTSAPPPTPVEQASPAATPEPTPEPTPATVVVNVYFTDRARFVSGEPPFEAAVTRTVPADANLPEAVLSEFFKGPTADEQAQGLELLSSGFTGYCSLRVQGGIAHVHLCGPCVTHGASYTIASPLIKNLLQFDEIQYVKIYDESGDTADPSGPNNSIPACLEP